MAANSSIPTITTEVLAKLEQHVEGRPVVYGTKFVRPEDKSKAASQVVASAVPSDGWLIVTPAGLHLFKKTVLGGVGKELSILTNEEVAGVSVAHGKKSSQTKITVMMVDHSSATLVVRTNETYPALSPWIRGASNAPSGDGGLGSRLPAVPDAPSFDPNELLGSIGGH